MKTICAWCGKVLVEGDISDGMLSHGICPDCMKGLVPSSEVSLMEFLNEIDFPILVTDGTVAVRQMNRTAERVLGGSIAALSGLSLGAAIECLHAGGPGGCGGSASCAGCVLRKTILETHEDGLPRFGIYSDHEIAFKENARIRRFRFSVTKAGEAVLLALDEVRDLPKAS